KRGSLQRYPGKQSLIARVRKNLRIHHDVGGSLRCASLWPSGGRRVCSKLYFARQQRARTLGIHYQQNKIGRLSAQLKADADSLQRVKRGGTPRPGVVRTTAAQHYSATVAASHAERTLLDRGQNHNAFRLV